MPKWSLSATIRWSFNEASTKVGEANAKVGGKTSLRKRAGALISRLLTAVRLEGRSVAVSMLGEQSADTFNCSSSYASPCQHACFHKHWWTDGVEVEDNCSEIDPDTLLYLPPPEVQTRFRPVTSTTTQPCHQATHQPPCPTSAGYLMQTPTTGSPSSKSAANSASSRSSGRNFTMTLVTLAGRSVSALRWVMCDAALTAAHPRPVAVHCSGGSQAGMARGRRRSFPASANPSTTAM